jgi:hypothetical protein
MKNFFLDAFRIASFLQAQGLNYFQGRQFVLDHYPGQVIGQRVDCAHFLNSANQNKNGIAKAAQNDPIGPPPALTKELDNLGI